MKTKQPYKLTATDVARTAQHIAADELLDVARKIIDCRRFLEELPSGIVETVADKSQDSIFTWEDDLAKAAVALSDAYIDFLDALEDEKPVSRKVS
jgi:hypothetical protein